MRKIVSLGVAGTVVYTRFSHIYVLETYRISIENISLHMQMNSPYNL